MPGPLLALAPAAISAAGAVMSGLSGGKANAKQLAYDKEKDRRREAFELQQRNRDWGREDQNDAYARAQKNALNPIHGQLYASMLNRVGMRGPRVDAMRDPRSAPVGPVQVNPAAMNDGRAGYGKPAAPPVAPGALEPEVTPGQNYKSWAPTAEQAAQQAAYDANQQKKREAEAMRAQMNAKMGGYR